jgi:plasmid stabilization system protein ParE
VTRYEVIIESAALDDIEHYYLRACTAGADRQAARWFNQIVAFIFKLEELPEWGSAVPEQDEFVEKLYQRIFGRGYRVIYTIVEQNVHVLCVRGPGMRELRPADIDLPH